MFCRLLLPVRRHRIEADIETAATLWVRRAGLTFAATICVGVGTILGLRLTNLAVQPDNQIGATQVGPWRFWPNVGRPDIDPYLRARYALSGEVPLAATEGLTAVARVDEDGRSLRRACRYRISGPVPAALFWTIEAAGEDGRPLENAARRYGFTASDVLRDSEGRFVIDAAASAKPGNWLPLSGSGRFILILRLYSASVSTSGARDGLALAFPSISLDDCL